MMDSSHQRKQTTRGIWASYNSTNKILVFDIEGTDSRERWEEKESYEKKTALFGLTVSNILLINIWVNDVGRYTGANYEILKSILELNLRYFNQETTKQIIFLIRDFRNEENLDYIRKTLSTDVERIWNEIKKPAAFESLPLYNFFKLLVVPIRSFIFEKEKWKNDVMKLRESLVDKNSPNYFFKELSFGNLPLDSLVLFMEKVWESIRNNKDINIPNQKIIATNFRCNQIKQEILNSAYTEISKIEIEVSKNPELGMGPDFEQILPKYKNIFKTATKYYDEIIVRGLEEDMEYEIKAKLEIVAKKRFLAYFDYVIPQMKSKLTSISTTSNQSAKQFLEDISKVEQEEIQSLNNLLKPLSMSSDLQTELKNTMSLKVKEAISSYISRFLYPLLKLSIQEYIVQIEDQVFFTFNNLSIESWDNFNKLLKTLVDEFNQKIHKLGNQSNDSAVIISQEMIKSLENDFLESVRHCLQLKKNGILKYLFEKFTKSLEVGETGMRRNWRIMEDKEIENIYHNAKQNILKGLKILDQPMTLEIDGWVFLTGEEAASIKTKFSNKCDDSLEQTYNKKYNRNSLQRVPIWMWILLAYFMHDHVLSWLRSPIIFLLIVLLSTGIGYLYATERLFYISFILTAVKNLVKSKFNSTPDTRPMRSQTMPASSLSSSSQSKKEAFEYR